MLDSPAYAHFRKVLIGFSQGGYLSYRMVAEHPDAFDRAILMSPSFKGETAEPLPATGRTRFALCYGSEDRTIPLADQQCAHNKHCATGNLTYSNIREWATASAIRKFVTYAPGWDCDMRCVRSSAHLRLRTRAHKLVFTPLGLSFETNSELLIHPNRRNLWTIPSSSELNRDIWLIYGRFGI